jgi:hypothetical protein
MIGDANLFFYEKDAGHAEINLMIAKALSCTSLNCGPLRESTFRRGIQEVLDLPERLTPAACTGRDARAGLWC